jgi:hypothetical protein
MALDRHSYLDGDLAQNRTPRRLNQICEPDRIGHWRISPPTG